MLRPSMILIFIWLKVLFPPADIRTLGILGSGPYSLSSLTYSSFGPCTDTDTLTMPVIALASSPSGFYMASQTCSSLCSFAKYTVDISNWNMPICSFLKKPLLRTFTLIEIPFASSGFCKRKKIRKETKSNQRSCTYKVAHLKEKMVAPHGSCVLSRSYCIFARGVV